MNTEKSPEAATAAAPDSRFRRLEEKLEDIHRNQLNTLQLLQGNPLNREDGGLIGTVHRLQTRVDALERLKDRGVAWLIGAGAGAGGFLTYVVNQIFHK